MKKTRSYRFSQLLSLLLGARIFILLFFTFTLYVSTFFLFNQEESLRKFVFDYKVHGIIFCAILSIAAGGIINRFYDKDKDAITKPFRTSLQGFLKEKYFLYSYILFNLFSLIISSLLSWRILLFFLIYQFFIWLYSHKLSKLLIVNNLSFVGLSLYPFFGMLVYYKHISALLLLMAFFLFFIMLAIDVVKDHLTLNVDKVFGYQTIANTWGKKTSNRVAVMVLLVNMAVSLLIVVYIPYFNYLSLYFILSMLIFILLISLLQKISTAWMLTILRLWVFVGVIFMLLNGIFERF